MGAVFLKFLNMSITAGYLIAAVILLRFLLKHSPKWICCLMWTAVAFRLLCPFTLESSMSLTPSAEVISQRTVQSTQGTVNIGIEFFTGINAIDAPVNDYLDSHYFEGVTVRANNLSIITSVMGVIWLIGIAAMLTYALISYLKVKKKVSVSLNEEQNIWICDEIKTPFILGIVKPKIYLPSSLSKEQEEYILAHERAHLARLDHIAKPFGFLILSLHWFNPLVWLSYVLFSKDIELACDERVIKTLDLAGKKSYSETLLSLSIPVKTAIAAPLAFSEIGIKERVRSVLSYKKPAVWITAAMLIVCVVLAAAFITSPVTMSSELAASPLNYKNAVNALNDEEPYAIYYPEVKSNEDGKILIGYVYGSDLEEFIESADWTVHSPPRSTLPSHGSVDFAVNDDLGCRILLYKASNWACVKYDGEVQWYKTKNGDYEKALSLLHSDEG